MERAFYIMQLWQTGNVGPHNITKIVSNPKEGFPSYSEAIVGMAELKKEGNWLLNQKGYQFAIMEIFTPKH
jgi:hypothetical protein